jgi:hypothetical protein
MTSQNCYPGSSYAFCNTCRMTYQPVVYQTDTDLDLGCPNCLGKFGDNQRLWLEQDEEPEEEEIKEDGWIGYCTFSGCDRMATFKCRFCESSVCMAHQNLEGLCDDCERHSSNAAWNDSFRDLD